MMGLGRMLWASSHAFGVTLLKAESRSSSGAISALRPLRFGVRKGRYAG